MGLTKFNHYNIAQSLPDVNLAIMTALATQIKNGLVIRMKAIARKVVAALPHVCPAIFTFAHKITCPYLQVPVDFQDAIANGAPIRAGRVGQRIARVSWHGENVILRSVLLAMHSKCQSLSCPRHNDESSSRCEIAHKPCPCAAIFEL